MAVKIIRTQDDPVLKEVSQPVNVEEIDSRIERLVENLLDTMYDAEGIGLAAPQIGILKRVIVVDTREEGSEAYKLINPVVVDKDRNTISQEGCLSFPGIIGELERAEKIKVEAYNLNKEKIIIEASDLLARVIQHEIDHLHGITIPDKALRIRSIDEMGGELGE